MSAQVGIREALFALVLGLGDEKKAAWLCERYDPSRDTLRGRGVGCEGSASLDRLAKMGVEPARAERFARRMAGVE